MIIFSIIYYINKKFFNINTLIKYLLVMKKNIIIVTGGAGFIGSNLIKFLLKKTSYKIISYDNYSTGKKKKSF